MPHLSFCIGVVEEDKLLEIRNVLEGIAKNFSSFSLVVDKLNIVTLPNGEKVSEFHVQKTEELQELPENLLFSGEKEMIKDWRTIGYEGRLRKVGSK